MVLHRRCTHTQRLVAGPGLTAVDGSLALESVLITLPCAAYGRPLGRVTSVLYVKTLKTLDSTLYEDI